VTTARMAGCRFALAVLALGLASGATRVAPPVAQAGAIVSAGVGANATAATAVDRAAEDDRTAWLRGQLATAPVGSTVDVPAGRYRGPFVIDRRLRLRATGDAHLEGDGTTHTVAVRAADVSLEGFRISGSGLDLGLDHAAVHVTGSRAAILGNRIERSLHGIYVRQADGVRIEGNTIIGTRSTRQPVDPFTSAPKPGESELCEVTLNQNRRGNGIHIWNSSRHVVVRNVIRDTRDGVYFSFVDRTEVRDNDIAGVRYGLHYMYSDENLFEGNVFRDNAAGAALMSSRDIVLRRNRFLANRSHRSYGVLLQTVDGTTLDANEITGNTVGVFFESGHGNRLTGNLIARNHIGIHASDSSDGNEFTGNRFVGNLHTVETTGGNLTSRWARDGRGNYWDGAVTIDLNRDGVIDLPHRELDVFGALRRDLPAIGLLAGSPGERLLRFVHARLALPGLPGVVDPAPLVEANQP
jgi:nitrous oxidase accessory protein